jgi:FlaA1/EpsC-like NDP-sugar epimerase
MIKKLTNWYFSRGALPFWEVFLADCFVVYMCGIVAYIIIHGINSFAGNLFHLMCALFAYLACYVVGFRAFKTYVGLVRRTTLRDLSRLGMAHLVGFALIVCLRLILYQNTILHIVSSADLLLQVLMSIAVMCGLRISAKNLYDIYRQNNPQNGAYGFSDDCLLNMEMKEFLNREPIDVNMDDIRKKLTGKRIMVTGAGGSIGSELAHLLANCCPAMLVLIDQAETPLHNVRRMMSADWPNIQCDTTVTNICHRHRMEHIFQKYHPQIIFHAAAYKHVPMMEDNPVESVLNNVDGTRKLADLAVKYGVENFVMISTDKAVNPTSVMGCSKRICEIYCQSLADSQQNTCGCKFITTRFGNVLGSNGSVIPIFREQIRSGGPVTVTHPDVIRYFMLIPEACKLVLEAAANGNGGEIYAFDMGSPIRIADLAKQMIRLSGKSNIEIKYTGLRSGEKLYEEVLDVNEMILPTLHKNIKIAKVRKYNYSSVYADINKLISIAESYDNQLTMEYMKRIVPEYKVDFKQQSRPIFRTETIRKIASCFMVALAAILPLDSFAKTTEHVDTTEFVSPTQTKIVKTDLEPLRVVTNKFSKNWFILASGGVHTFRGDYSKVGSFWGTISPEASVGFGKWFTPGIAVKAEVMKSSSKGYTEYLKGHYGYGDVLQNEDGTSYRKMKTNWTDIGASVMFNISRLIYGYEGYLSPHRMNQFMVNFGVGAALRGKDDNILSARFEFQYSRYFTKSKRFSLDFKIRAFVYESNFDLEYGQADYSAKKVDVNIGPQIGFTINLGSPRTTAWEKAYTEIYRRDFRERQVTIERTNTPSLEYGTLTFYVFFPNNYSGRNDAPLTEYATVNAIDYLASGIYTQKRFVDNGHVATNLVTGASLKNLSITDMATEKSNQAQSIPGYSRGYELDSLKMSLDVDIKHMSDFREQFGYYYAPIYDGNNTWHYRIDDAALGQNLLDKENYKETQSFGLNSHRGIDLIRQRMDVDKSDLLVSFADVYAAMTSNSGYIAEFTDSATVNHIRDILDKGYITMIQAEGLSTSQDNYTGEDATTVIKDRNTALSNNRAKTVIEWLKENQKLSDVSSQIYLVNHMENGISAVNDTSVRGLDAKLNRCTKIRIHYMLKSDE